MTITESDIKAALISQSGNIYSKSDAADFLRTKDYYKHVGARFLCWMIQLELISPVRSKWVGELSKLHNSYSNIRIRFVGKDPLSMFTDRERRLIEQDVTVSQPWFEKMIEQTGIQPHYKEDAKSRFFRIAAAISTESPQLVYTQGNDRFVWMAYLVSLSFSSNGGLDRCFAESMAYFLAREIIMHIRVARFVEDYAHLQRHFAKLDWLLEREEPEIAEILDQEHSAINYALKWELTLFADEHNAHDLMFLWDQIFTRLDDYNEFLRCLCVAHIKQVPVSKSADQMAINIQKCRNWDVSKIVDDAADMMVTKEVNCFAKFFKKIFTMCHHNCVF